MQDPFLRVSDCVMDTDSEKDRMWKLRRFLLMLNSHVALCPGRRIFGTCHGQEQLTWSVSHRHTLWVTSDVRS
jgi:hypothetical protein